MPPNHNRSQDDLSSALINSFGVHDFTVRPVMALISGDRGMVLSDLGKIPPPFDINLVL